jgi:glycine/D-amino acid oxidase-like deaminating enzyme
MGPAAATSRSPDVAIIGAGIVGCALAAFLAEGGARVAVFECDDVAAAASGRNSGIVVHPLDETLVPLFAESVEHYRTLGHGFALPPPPGLLLLARSKAALGAEEAALAQRFPELRPEPLAGAALREEEPALAPGVAAIRVDTGHPVPPAAATRAFAARARAAGAAIHTGAAATPAVAGGRAQGVRADGTTMPAGAVVVAAGPWTPAVAGGWDGRPPIAPVWGVNVEVALAELPRHVLEEAGVEGITAAPDEVGSIFSLVTAEGSTSLGSTFLLERPEPDPIAPVLKARGARFVPALAQARIVSARVCGRPQSLDGRPLLGPAPGVDALYVAAGHGPWGISCGPASGRLVADALLGRGAIPAAFAAGRFGAQEARAALDSR